MRTVSLKWFNKLQFVGLIAFLGALLIALVGIVAWFWYDDAVRECWGIPAPLVKFFLASYGPTIGGTFLGLRDFLGYAFVGQTRKPPAMPIKHGSWFPFVMTLGGTFVALVGILVVAHGIDEEKAKNVIMICAACWTGSTGYVYSSLLKDKVKLSEAAPKQA